MKTVRKHKWWFTSIFSLIIVTALGLTFLWGDVPAVADDSSETMETPVSVVTTESMTIMTKLQSIGHVDPTTSVNVMTMAGTIREVKKGIGDWVNKGQIIFTVTLPGGSVAEVTSPIEGKVSTLYVERGEAVSVGLGATIIDDRRKVVNTSVTADQLKDISKLQETQVIIGDQTLRGYVGLVNNTTTNRNGLYDVEIELISNADDIIIGEFAYVHFIVDESTYQVVPEEVVKRDGDQFYVFVEENGVAVKRTVEVGPREEGKIAILSGLDDQARIVALGSDFINDQDDIRVN